MRGEDEKNFPGTEPSRRLWDKSTERRDEMFFKSIHETVPDKYLYDRLSS